MRRRIGLILVSILLFASGLQAKEYFYSEDGVSVKIEVDREEITLAETLGLEITVKYPDGVEVELPQVEDSNDYIVIGSEEDRRLDVNEDKLVYSVMYRLEPLTEGLMKIGGFGFSFVDGNEPVTVETEAIEVKVVKTIDPNDPNVIANASEIEPVAMPPFEAKWWMFGPIFLVLVLIMVLAYLQKKKSRSIGKLEVVLPAHEIALRQLQELMNENLIAAGKIKLFYERLSNILRNYIEARFDINAPDQTTEEFLNELSVSRTLDDEDKKSLGEFLKQCDLVKFAKHTPEQKDVDDSVGLAVDFIEKTKVEPGQREEVGS